MTTGKTEGVYMYGFSVDLRNIYVWLLSTNHCGFNHIEEHTCMVSFY